MRVTSLSFDTVGMEFDFDEENPNDVSATLSSIGYELDVEGTQVLKGTQNKSLTIEAKKSSLVTLPLNVTISSMVKSVQTLINKKELPYRLQTSFGVSTPIGVITMPGSTSGVLPLPTLPKLSLLNTNAKIDGLSRIELEFNIEVLNNGSFPMKLDELRYQANVAGVNLAQGERPGKEIAARNKAIIPITVGANVSDIAKAGLSILGSKELPYRLETDVKLGVFNYPIKFEGKTKL